MSEPFLSEIKIMSFLFAPKGWALCNGQLLPINQNQALFSLIGTYYGGDGRFNFGLPNLQGRIPMHMGSGHTLGEASGEQNHTLNMSEIPPHSHPALCSSNPGAQASPSGSFWAQDNNGNTPYAGSDGATLSPAALTNAGGSQPHVNMAPSLTLNFCIALTGIFPSQT
jgi:microcystin-dependent protein